MLGQLGLLKVAADVLFLDAVEDRGGEVELEQFGGRGQVGFQHLTDVHARGHAQGVQDNIDGGAVLEKGHVRFGDDLGDDPFVAMAAGHLVADGKFTLGGDVDLNLFDDAHIHFIAGFGALDFFVVLHLEVVEFLLKLTDDFVDFVADGRGVNFDAIVDLGQLAQEGLGDLAIGRDDDLARLAVDDVQGDLFA